MVAPAHALFHLGEYGKDSSKSLRAAICTFAKQLLDNLEGLVFVHVLRVKRQQYRILTSTAALFLLTLLPPLSGTKPKSGLHDELNTKTLATTKEPTRKSSLKIS